MVSYVLTPARCPGVSTASFLDPTLIRPVTSHNNPEFVYSITSIKLKNKGLYKGSKSQSIFDYSGMKIQRLCLEIKFMEINCKTPEI